MEIALVTVIGSLVALLGVFVRGAEKRLQCAEKRNAEVTDKFFTHVDKSNETHERYQSAISQVAVAVDKMAEWQKANHKEVLEKACRGRARAARGGSNEVRS